MSNGDSNCKRCGQPSELDHGVCRTCLDADATIAPTPTPAIQGDATIVPSKTAVTADQ